MLVIENISEYTNTNSKYKGVLYKVLLRLLKEFV